MQRVLTNCPELRTLYLLKEEFRTICDKIKDHPKLNVFYVLGMWKAQRTGNRFLLKFVQTLRN